LIDHARSDLPEAGEGLLIRLNQRFSATPTLTWDDCCRNTPGAPDRQPAVTKGIGPLFEVAH
jgi:hypothetical protein